MTTIGANAMSRSDKPHDCDDDRAHRAIQELIDTFGTGTVLRAVRASYLDLAGFAIARGDDDAKRRLLRATGHIERAHQTLFPDAN
jgi:hypothetical protein